MERKILDCLERIELQLKAVWWDNLMFSIFVLVAIAAVESAVTSLKILGVFSLIFFIAGIIIVQTGERSEIRKIKEYYEKLKGGFEENVGKEVQTQENRNL